MHLPELALLIGAHGGVRRWHGPLVEAQGVVLENNTDVFAVLVLDLLESRTDSLTVRSLKVRYFDHRHPGVFWPLDRRMFHRESIGLLGIRSRRTFWGLTSRTASLDFVQLGENVFLVLFDFLNISPGDTAGKKPEADEEG